MGFAGAVEHAFNFFKPFPFKQNVFKRFARWRFNCFSILHNHMPFSAPTDIAQSPDNSFRQLADTKCARYVLNHLEAEQQHEIQYPIVVNPLIQIHIQIYTELGFEETSSISCQNKFKIPVLFALNKPFRSHFRINKGENKFLESSL